MIRIAFYINCKSIYTCNIQCAGFKYFRNFLPEDHHPKLDIKKKNWEDYIVQQGSVRRINLKVHKMPYSLRKFFEQTMQDDLAFKSALESPLKAMAAAGVNVDATGFSRRDYIRIVEVLVNLRKCVKTMPKEKVNFGDIFNIAEADPYWTGKESETNTCRNENWDCSKPESSTDKGSNECAWDGFEKDTGSIGQGFSEKNWQEVIVDAPLISSSTLAEIMVQMNMSLKTYV